MDNASVTVVIVNWNSGELLGQCLSHLSRQSCLPHQVLVIDNGSIDGSAECTQGMSRVTVRLVGDNLGFAKANNLALRECDTEFVVLLNPDAFPLNTWLERLLVEADKHPEYACFASRQVLAEDRGRLDGTGDAYHVSGLHWRRGYGACAAGSFEETEEVYSACAAAAMYRIDALREVGGFDKSFFCYAEDVDLGFRLRLAGHRCLYVSDAVVEHVGSASCGRCSDFTVYHGHRNLVWVYFKNMPWPLFWLYLPQHLLLNLVTIIWFALRGQGRVILRAKWDALMGLPRVWRQRRAIQRSCTVSAWEIRRMMSRGLFAILWRR